MNELTNAEVFEGLITGLYTTVGRRTSQSFAVAVIDAIVRALESRYDFLRFVRLNIEDGSEKAIIDTDLNSVDSSTLGKAAEAIIQIMCMDLKDRAGFYFINEFKDNAGGAVVSGLKDIGVDLDMLKIQQHYLFRQSKRIKTKPVVARGHKKKLQEEKNLLNYSWDNVSSWDYDSNRKICIIYGKDGNVLDQLNLDEIVKDYISSLTETEQPSTDYKRETKEKSLKL